MNFSKAKPYVFILMGIITPICATLSALLPIPIRQLAILFWMILFPMVIFGIKARSSLLFLLMAICILILQTNNLAFEHPQKLFSLSIALITMIYVISSHLRLDDNSIRNLSMGLGFGALFVNIITLYALYLISSGVLDIIDFAERFGIPHEFGVFRFALGNAIHVPFLMSLCTIIGTRYLRSQPLIFLLICLNLITATIAQSRGVFLISLFHLVFLYPKLNSYFKVIIPAAFVFTFAYFFEEISVVTDSLIARLTGDDYGSTDVRTQMLDEVVDNFDVSIAVFGGGLLSSQQLIFESMGDFATVEAALLELSYELGIFTVILFLLPFVVRIVRIGMTQNIPIYFYLILGQSFLLVPVSAMFGLTFTLTVFLLDCYRNKYPLNSKYAGNLKKLGEL